MDDIGAISLTPESSGVKEINIKKLIKHFILDTDYKLISFASKSSEAKEINLKRGGGKNKEILCYQ